MFMFGSAGDEAVFLITPPPALRFAFTRSPDADPIRSQLGIFGTSLWKFSVFVSLYICSLS